MYWSAAFALSALIGSFCPSGSLPTDTVETYEGHQVYDITIENDHHKTLLPSLIDEHELDVWRYPKSYGDTTSVRVRPEFIRQLLESLNKHGLHYRIKIRDVQDLVSEELKSITDRRQKRAASFDRYNYQNHATINEFLATLASQCAHCSVQSIGKSHQGRSMDVLKISSGGNKVGIFIDGGIHAREWISPATVINIMYAIATDPSLQYLLDWFDWHFLPVANPDGYEYSITNSRFWRKTRSLHSGCYGTDPNRNFDYEWGKIGASTNPCSETFRGTVAFSEIETQHMRDYILANRNTLRAYLTFHSYGQYFLYPWGYTGCGNNPSDEAALRQAANAAAEAIQKAPGGRQSRYSVGTSGCVLYPAAGGSDDWAKGAAGVKYSYTVELPDTGSNGFVLPASQIEPVSLETIAGIKAFATDLRNQLTRAGK